MSLQAAIGRIDSIISLQQQLRDPAAATASTTAASTTAGTVATPTTGATAAGGQATFAQMLAGAQQSAAGTAEPVAATLPTTTMPTTAMPTTTMPTTTMPTTAMPGSPMTGASANAPAQVQAMTAKAESLVGLPYVWGGGHGGWGPQRGYDCSGFVSAVLHSGGYLTTPQDTTSMPSAPGMVAGPGQYVTVYDRTGSGESGHVIIDIAGQFYESGGGHGAWGGGGGVEKIGRPSASYLATFDTLLHPQGL